MAELMRSQRWRERRTSFALPDTTFSPDQYVVDLIPCVRVAKPFVELHHYTGTFPASRLSLGLFRQRQTGAELCGVCTFSVPVNNASIPLHTGFADPLRATDLGRLVLLDQVPANAESWFVAKAFRLLRREKPGIEAVVAYSDPVPRLDEMGRVIMPGHIGTVYQALSAELRGRSAARTDHILPNGRILSPRALSKLRSGDVGASYAERQILDAGAPARGFAEDPAQWVSRLIDQHFITRRRHSGNLVYTFALTKAAKIAGRTKPKLPYGAFAATTV